MNKFSWNIQYLFEDESCNQTSRSESGLTNIFTKAESISFARRIPDIVTVKKPVFIIGCGRSGTTLFFNILKEHPGLAPTTGHPDGEDHVGWNTHGGTIISGIYGHAGVGDAGHVVGYHLLSAHERA